jgi:hypothetical protein
MDVHRYFVSPYMQSRLPMADQTHLLYCVAALGRSLAVQVGGCTCQPTAAAVQAAMAQGHAEHGSMPVLTADGPASMP